VDLYNLKPGNCLGQCDPVLDRVVMGCMEVCSGGIEAEVCTGCVEGDELCDASCVGCVEEVES